MLAIRPKKSTFGEDIENKIADTLSEFAAETGLYRLISLKHKFPHSLHQLLHPLAGQAQTTEFSLEKKHFPYFIADKELTLSTVKVYLKPRQKDQEIDTASGLTLKLNDVTALGSS